MLSRFRRFPMLCHCNLFHPFVGSVKRLYEHQNYKIQMNPSKWKWKMLSKIRCFMQNPHKTITIGAAFTSEASMPCGNQQPKNSRANGWRLLHNHHRHHWCVLFSHGRSEQSSMDPLHTKGAPSTPWTKTPTINAAKVNSLTHTANLNEIVWNLERGMRYGVRRWGGAENKALHNHCRTKPLFPFERNNKSSMESIEWQRNTPAIYLCVLHEQWHKRQPAKKVLELKKRIQ